MTDSKQYRLNENEQIILKSIEDNPYITQQELADHLGLSRPSIANLISGLVREGHILGKAYILNRPKQIVCIGGANVDRKFRVNKALQLGTSNPIQSTQTVGGVARNIGENLGRLGEDVTLLTVSGHDADWSFIDTDSSLYMDLSYVTQLPDANTGSYTAVLDAKGDLEVAFADMDAYDLITPELILKEKALLSQAKCIIMDLNCPIDTLQSLIHFGKNHHIPVAFIPVSAPKMNRLPKNLDGVSWVITNLDESEIYFDIEINDKIEWKEAVKKWLKLGIEHVAITNGAEGIMIGSHEEGVLHVPAMSPSHIADVTGAGDAFCSAAIYAWLEGQDLFHIAQSGIVNATRTLESTHTVRKNLSSTQLQKDMEELI